MQLSIASKWTGELFVAAKQRLSDIVGKIGFVIKLMEINMIEMRK